MADDSELLFVHFIGESVPIDRFEYFHLKTPHKQILSRKKSAAFVYCHKGLELLSSVQSSAQRAIFSANQGRTEKTFEPRKMGISGKKIAWKAPFYAVFVRTKQPENIMYRPVLT